MTETEHVHKLKKHKYKNGTDVFFCSLNCNFKIDAPLALGKIVLCWTCEQPFAMTEYTVKLSRPHCVGCGKIRVKDENGKLRLRNKDRMNPIAAGIAESATKNLRQRLGTVITMEKPTDEDI